MNLVCDPRLYSQDYAQLCKKVYWDKTSCYYLFLILKRLGITGFCRDLKMYLCQRFFTVPVPTFAHYVFLVESKFMYNTFAKELLHSLCTQKMTVVREKIDENVLACLLKSFFLSEIGPVILTGRYNGSLPYRITAGLIQGSYHTTSGYDDWRISKIHLNGSYSWPIMNFYDDTGLNVVSKLLIYFYRGGGEWDFDKEEDRNEFMAQHLSIQTFLICIL